jgi:hypothetical protein
MRAVVIYESMYGNTHVVADAIGRGLGADNEVLVLPVAAVTQEVVAAADLVVIGGPTHVHGMTRESTRHAAIDAAEKDDTLEVDPDAEGPGLRDWFDGLERLDAAGAAFDTRIDVSPVLSGRASKGIHKRLRRHGLRPIAEPESFLVDKQSHLLADEAERAEAWGAQLAASMATEAPAPT